jgi:signal transduction protein with GAF and PtsI domain
MIDKQAAGIAKAMGMPNVRTTTVDKELEKNKKNKEFKTKVFAILDDVSAEEYSAFINYIMKNSKTTTIIREEQNWTKDGELIRVIDYIEELD